MSAIYERLSTAVLEANEERILKLVQKGLDEGLGPKDILDNGLIVGMNEVGARFKRGDMFVPEVLMSAKGMQAGLGILRPHLVASGAKLMGTIVIGTVKGDLHDIGKNIVAMMLESAGFRIVDLGVDASPEKIVAAVREHNANFVAMSALLTTTMVNMKAAIEALDAAGLRGQVKVMVGGAPVTESWARSIGADGYGKDAPAAVELARSLVAA